MASKADYMAAVSQSAATPQVFLMFDSKCAKSEKELRDVDFLMKSDKMFACRSRCGFRLLDMQTCRDFVKADMLPVIYVLQGAAISARLVGRNLARKLWAEYKKLPLPHPHEEASEPNPELLFNSVQALSKSKHINPDNLYYKC